MTINGIICPIKIIREENEIGMSIASLRREINSINGQISRYRVKIVEYEATKVKIETAKQKLSNVTENLQLAYENLTINYQSEEGKKKGNSILLISGIVSDVIDSMINTINYLDSQVSAIKRQIERSENKIASLRRQIKKLQDDLNVSGSARYD